ncbi:MAG: RidA family protein [Micromonosporaceae bacterium]|nr:RidA family protein [Micromonosporaceae bacterium]
MTITHINPPDLHASPVFSQGVLTEGGRTLYVGGQNGTDATGAIVPGGIGEQSAQAMRNLLAVLAAAGAGPEHVVKMNIYLTADADLSAAFAASSAVWGRRPTAVTVLRVAGLARADALVEIDAIAVVP